MGLIQIICPKCNETHLWFSGNADQRCEICVKASLTLKDHVKGIVKFQYYRDGQLFYRTQTNLVFPVPIADTDKGIFLAEDKAMLFMRYIRKFLESTKS